MNSTIFQVGNHPAYNVRRIGNEIRVNRGDAKDGVLVRVEHDSVRIDGNMGRKKHHCVVHLSPQGADVRTSVIWGANGPSGGKLLAEYKPVSGIKPQEYESFGLSIASSMIGLPLNLPYSYEGP